jgi:hypothetical protein
MSNRSRLCLAEMASDEENEDELGMTEEQQGKSVGSTDTGKSS